MPTVLEDLVVELAEQSRSRYYGKYRGVVADIEDPEGIGRIRARVPDVFGDAVLTPWALPCAPYAGPQVGQFMIPPLDAGVWIEFEAGDPSRPIWTGGWWGTRDVPNDQDGNAATPQRKLLRSDQGLLVALDDDSNTLSVSDGDGQNLLKISVNQGQVRVQAAAKVIVEAPQIELVDGAPHPLVFGDDLLQYLNQLVALFNAHLHVGQTAAGIPVTPAPPVPNYPSATPALLSTRVKTG